MPSSLAHSPEDRRSSDGASPSSSQRRRQSNSDAGPAANHELLHVSADAANPSGSNDEQSPLLTPDGENDTFLDNESAADEVPDTYQATKSVWWMILLTISIGGLQIAWSVELSNGSPYLLSLGLSKSLMALVWIAGPLSGTLVQPYVGMLSDSCRIPWGKRKPFMLGGTVATVLSLMFLAWTREIVSGFLGLFGANTESDGVKVSIIVTAVLWVYILDFAINTGVFIAVAASWSVLTRPVSPSRHSSLYCGLRPDAPARLVDHPFHPTWILLVTDARMGYRGRECHGKPNRRSRQHHRLRCRLR
jgi:solute carrier family 45, member 1/2/4